MLTLLGGLAQVERELIGERTRSALAHKRENGQPTSHPPLGFTANDNRERMVVAPKEVAIVRRILEGWRAGSTYLGVAAQLNAEDVPTKRCRWKSCGG